MEVTDMDFAQGPQNEDTNLMRRASKVTSQSPPPPMSKPVPSEQGDNVILDDDLVMDMYNLSFDDFQKNIV